MCMIGLDTLMHDACLKKQGKVYKYLVCNTESAELI